MQTNTKQFRYFGNRIQESTPKTVKNPSIEQHTRIVPLVSTDFLHEKDIPQDEVLRKDYEKLRITYELQRDIGSEIDIDIVSNRILDRTFQFLKYDRGIILLLDKEGKFKARAYRNKTNGKKYFISKTLIGHVIRNRQGIISSDIPSDNRFNEAESIMVSGVRSTIAAPVLHRDEILGVIVIESSQSFGAFNEKDLHLIMNIANHAAQFIKNSLLHEELQISFSSAIRALSATVDARHTLTAGHSERVTKFSLLIAKELGVNGNKLENLKYAALLHDIGKIGISDKVLLKKGPFEIPEREEMRTHPTKTNEILEKFHFPRMLRDIPKIAAHHHERIDGQGYPNGLNGSELSLETKIISVADVFDALTSPRDYPKYNKKGKTIGYSRMPISDAVTLIENEVGSHFENIVVTAFKRCLPLVLMHFRGTHFKPEYVDDFIKSHAPNLLSEL
jgi:putative nucleotidyltransferase with HDIG domain